MGLSPPVFWSLTLKELSYVMRSRLDGLGFIDPPERCELSALMQSYPDK